jgi:hypothetical protein
MSILKKLFGVSKGKVEVRPLRGFEPAQSESEQAGTRARMEAEMAADQERRRTHSQGTGQT